MSAIPGGSGTLIRSAPANPIFIPRKASLAFTDREIEFRPVQSLYDHLELWILPKDRIFTLPIRLVAFGLMTYFAFDGVEALMEEIEGRARLREWQVLSVVPPYGEEGIHQRVKHERGL